MPKKTTPPRFAFLLLLITLGWLSPALSLAAGIRGTVRDETGAPMSFASIYVKETGSGAVSNAEGYYELALRPGTYSLIFQYLGYATVTLTVNVGSDWVMQDVKMKPQVTELATVTVKSGKEDPAYAIMRKAISKANYHRNVLDKYSAKVYIKGAGKVIDYPFLLSKKMKEEGIEKGRVFISESVSEVKFTRPNKYDQKVISVRSDGKDNNTSPGQFVFNSFYEPSIGEVVTPFSPKAFSVYKFEYEGFFEDRGYVILKIKVTPRIKAEDVLEGYLYIVEDWWSIHSMDMSLVKLGMKIKLNSIYTPVEEKVWLPVTHKFKVDGKFFGVEFAYDYLATVKDYKITINQEVYTPAKEMVVVDEKTEKQSAAKAQTARKSAAKQTKAGKTKELQQRLEEGKEITRKELNSVIREYEKQELKEQKEPDVLSEYNFSIDSVAYKKDSIFWDSIRPVPLSRDEIRGYQKTDSMAVVERKKEEGDTVKDSKHRGFQVWDVLIGDSYRVGKHSNFRIHPLFGGFNTVEGWNLIYKLTYGVVLQDTNRTRLNITPTFRYAVSRKLLSGQLNVSLRTRKARFEAEGGRYIAQYNPENPILPFINTFTTLLMEQNFMKIYERDFVELRYRRTFSPRYRLNTSVAWMRRRELFNNSNYKLVDRESIGEYSVNRPVNNELDNTGFDEHEATVAMAELTLRPWLKFSRRDGRREEIRRSSPTFVVRYRTGIPTLGSSDVNFNQIDLSVRHTLNPRGMGDFDFYLKGGTFLSKKQLYFMDYAHFLGNRTPFSTVDPVSSFRLLDYYSHSTASAYLVGSVHYQLRRFLITNITKARMLGFQENLFLSFLGTRYSKPYLEVGYGLDGFLRLFRLEVAASFDGGSYRNYGFRLGISTKLVVNFQD